MTSIKSKKYINFILNSHFSLNGAVAVIEKRRPLQDSLRSAEPEDLPSHSSTLSLHPSWDQCSWTPGRNQNFRRRTRVEPSAHLIGQFDDFFSNWSDSEVFLHSMQPLQLQIVSVSQFKGLISQTGQVSLHPN